MTSVTYTAVSARGVVIHTFDTLEAAKRWASDRKDSLPGISVEEVVTTVLRRRVYRPGLRLVVGR